LVPAGVLVIVLVLAGCGTSRPAVPSLLTPAAPSGFRTLGYPRAHVALRAPRNWTLLGERAPMVAVISSGPAEITLWSFSDSATPPAGGSGLAAARTALIAAARRRQPGLRVLRSSLVTVGGRGTVELDVLERLQGRLRRVRSMHIYLPGSELVLEEIAPPARFHSVDHLVFSPVKRSLRLLAGGGA
jgi:hypothetical protein